MTKQSHIILIISSLVMMLLMGTVYAYSVFRLHIENQYQVGTLLSGLPYMTSLFFYASSMMVTGRFLKSRYLRRFVFYGTLLISFGWLISSIATSIWMLTFSYGVLIGIGVGMVYGIPIFMVQKLYPKRSGLMTGIILLGFGMSPLITAPLASALIHATSLKTSFLIFGLAFLVIQLPLSYVFIMKEYQEFKKAADEPFVHEKLTPFKRIYLLFVIATTIGLMMIGLSYQVGVIYYQFGPREVTLSLSFFALMNGVARPLFGMLMDKKGFKFSVVISLSLIGLASIIGLINRGQFLYLYIISFGLFWFNLGAWLSIVPATIKAFYGIKYYARKYGIMFTAYGVGSIIGTLISGTIMDALGLTSYIYIAILILILVSLGIMTQIKMPKKYA